MPATVASDKTLPRRGLRMLVWNEGITHKGAAVLVQVWNLGMTVRWTLNETSL
jgi:hypothetical protein